MWSGTTIHGVEIVVREELLLILGGGGLFDSRVRLSLLRFLSDGFHSI